jgi:hypothetical protein
MSKEVDPVVVKIWARNLFTQAFVSQVKHHFVPDKEDVDKLLKVSIYAATQLEKKLSMTEGK